MRQIAFEYKMTIYNYLLNKKQSGELSILLRYLELSPKFLQWMDICEYHLRHPEKSQFQVALHFNVNKKTIWRAYKLLNQSVR